MSSKIIYLHIPKSGGTSQRFTFFRIYGKEQVFWHGINDQSDSHSFSDEELASSLIIGGHKPLTFYPEGTDALFLSAVRDPVERAVSLYSYYAKPHFAEEGYVPARENLFESWRKRGMDGASLVKSLENCAQFRREIQNYQCHYLSRYDNSLEGVLQSLEQISCIVCDQAHSDEMNAILAKKFAWPSIPSIRTNTSLKETHERILDEPGAREALEQFMQEDLKLFHYIQAECNGLYQNRTQDIETETALIAGPGRPAGASGSELWRHVQLYSKGYLSLDDSGSGSVGLALINNGKKSLLPQDYPGLAFSYTILNRTGDEILNVPGAQLLRAPVDPRGHLNVSLKVSLDAPLRQQAHIIQIGLSMSDNKMVEDFNPLHPASACILPLT